MGNPEKLVKPGCPFNLDDHPYVPPGPDDSRSPCPGLNILANHGFLPHDGKGLTSAQLIQQTMAVFNLSLPLSSILSIGGVLTCGRDLKVDLAQLALHDRIEHDASLVRDNVVPPSVYAPIAIDEELVKEFLADASYDVISEELVYTAEDFGKIRGRRNKEALTKPLDVIHTFISRANPALILMAMGGERRVAPQSAVQQFLAEERLPDGFVKPAPITLTEAIKIASVIAKATPST